MRTKPALIADTPLTAFQSGRQKWPLSPVTEMFEYCPNWEPTPEKESTNTKITYARVFILMSGATSRERRLLRCAASESVSLGGHLARHRLQMPD